MTELPWGLEFSAEAEAGLAVRHSFDALDARLSVTVANTGGDAAALKRVRLTAPLDLPAAGGSLWVQGRYMQMDAFVHAFGTPEPEGYSGDAVRTDGETRRYRSREMVALTLPVRATPAFVAGSLRGDRFFLDLEVELDAEETVVRSIALVFDLTGTTLAPGETLALQPVLLSEGRGVLPQVDLYADEVAAEMGARVPGRDMVRLMGKPKFSLKSCAVAALSFEEITIWSMFVAPAPISGGRLRWAWRIRRARRGSTSGGRSQSCRRGPGGASRR